MQQVDRPIGGTTGANINNCPYSNSLINYINANSIGQGGTGGVGGKTTAAVGAGDNGYNGMVRLYFFY